MSRLHWIKAMAGDPVGFLAARRIRSKGLTYLDHRGLLDLRDRVREADEEGRVGVLLEAGVALGGSAVMMALTKNQERPLHLYDVFGTIPTPGERDGQDVHERYAEITAGASTGINGATYYGYRDDLMQEVADTLRSFRRDPETHNIELIRGLYEETMHPSSVAVAHIDADWYDSVTICLDRIWPVLAPQGVIVIDDYDAWSGCREAVDDWMAGRAGVHIERRARLHLVKSAS